MKTPHVRLFCSILVSLLLAAGQLAPVMAQDDTTADGQAMRDYRAQSRLRESVFGPERGALVHDPDKIVFAPAGVNLRNVYAKVRFVVPYSGDEQLWDVGFVFRSGRDVDWRVVIYSDETWDVRLGSGDAITGGDIANLKTGVDDFNELELAIDGDVGLLAVNAEDVGSFDVSSRGVAGDVALGTSFVESAYREGAELAYSRFQVWELPGSDAIEIDDTATALMESSRLRTDTHAPIGGPDSGTLEESLESVPVALLGVETVDFFARIEVTNPRDGAARPFDFGLGIRDAGGDTQYRLIFASDGSWYLKLGTDGALAAENFDGLLTDAGETNLIEVVASGADLVFAVNGDVVGSADISDLRDPGDIAFGVGFYPDFDVVEGDVTSYTDFAAWSLTGGAADPAETARPTERAETPVATERPGTVAPESTATGASGQPSDPAAAFDDYLERTDSLDLVFGPEQGDLAHDATTLTWQPAGLNLTDFILHVDFINPYPASETSWDFGALFRHGDADPHFRLIVTSNGNWFLSLGSGDPLQQGKVDNLNLRANGRNTLDLVVDGDIGLFSVNEEFVDILFLTEILDAGDVGIGTSFFEGSFQEGAATPYENFLVWSLESGAATPQPTAGSGETPVAGNSYESPTYGYSVAFDDSWEIVDESTDPTDGDYVRLGNGVSTVDFSGFESDFTPRECLDWEFDYYSTAPGYSNAEIATNANDNEMTGEIDNYAWGVYTFTFTVEGGDPVDYAAYAECRPIEAGQSMLRIVQFVEFESYESEIEARDALLAGLALDGTVAATPGPTTPEATARSGESNSIVQISAVDGSDIQALATISESGDRSSVRVLAIGADDGAIVVIQTGGCDRLSGEPEFLLNPIDGGISETTIRIDATSLIEGGFSITIHDDLNDLALPLACGQIGAVG